MTDTLTGIVEQFDYWKKAALPAPISDRSSTQVIIGCGTSYNLALSIAAVMNSNGYRALAVPAGEWLQRHETYLPANVDNFQVIALSRSGETTETVQAADFSKTLGVNVIGITCAPDTALSRVATSVLEYDTHAAEGIVMTSSASLMQLAGMALGGLITTPESIANSEVLMNEIAALPIEQIAKRKHFVFLGGGTHYGIALEGALKLQEMAITYTQGFHPGEYRHGPVSLVDDATCIVMLYNPQSDEDEAKLVGELQEKGALVLGLGGAGDLSISADKAIANPCELLPALQLLGERYSQVNGVDTTQPRHLTKVVRIAS